MRLHWLLVALLLACNTHAWGSEAFHGRSPETGLGSWKASHLGVTLELTQITPDQARAFFMGRGFERMDTEHYAATCVFMTILRNESAAAAVSYRLAEWSAFPPGGNARPMKLKEDWLKEWEARGMAQAQKIAFEWSQLPSVQTFEPGDWNQGMTTFMLPRGSRFDLKYRWTVQGKDQENILKGVRCAEENSGF